MQNAETTRVETERRCGEGGQDDCQREVSREAMLAERDRDRERERETTSKRDRD